MSVEKILSYVPAGDAILGLLNAEQKTWLHNNVNYLAPYINSKEGSEALHLFLIEFAEFVLKQNKAT